MLNLRDGFSDMRDLLGYEGALMAMLLEPQHFDELLERCGPVQPEAGRRGQEAIRHRNRRHDRRRGQRDRAA